MCLLSKQILPRRATKDIVCYKLFKKKTKKKKKTGEVTVRYESRFRNNHVYGPNALNIVLQAKTIGPNVPLWIPETKHTMVRTGYFHAYQTAQNDLISLHTSWAGVVLLKCIIPKGALYYKGINGDICANQMIFEKEIYW